MARNLVARSVMILPNAGSVLVVGSAVGSGPPSPLISCMAIGGLLCALPQQSPLVGPPGQGGNGPRFTGPSLVLTGPASRDAGRHGAARPRPDEASGEGGGRRGAGRDGGRGPVAGPDLGGNPGRG